MLTHEQLLKLLDYSEETGIFTWKIQRRPQSPVSSPAGSIYKGVVRIEINNKNYLAHRLAWFFVYKKWPSKQIDHKNGNKQANWLKNLREANNSQNQANQFAKSNNKLGIRGVSFRRGKYVVQMCKTTENGKVNIRKTFICLSDARKFAKQQSKILHGKFSYLNR